MPERRPPTSTVVGRRRPLAAETLDRDRRGVTPAVSKTLEIGIVVLFVGLVSTTVLGGAVPEYRTSTGEELGDRVLVTASQGIEDAVPPTGREVSVRRSVDLPGTIAGSGYAVRTDGRELVLDHPDDRIEGRVRLALPPSVARVDGAWDSGGEHVVVVTDGSSGLVVELRDGGGA